jgi:hypothetical protein
MIQALINVQEDMLKIPGLSNKQKDDIINLRQELNALNLQTDESNFKLQLIDIMNRLN